MKSAGQDGGELQQTRIEQLSLADDLRQWSRGNFAVIQSDEDAVLLPRERFHGGGGKSRGENAVESGGRAAALHVAEFYIAQIEAEPLAMLAKILHESFSVVSRTFGHNHNSVALAAIVAVAQATRQRFGIGFDFGQRDGFRASGNAGGQRQIATVAAHRPPPKKRVREKKRSP